MNFKHGILPAIAVLGLTLGGCASYSEYVKQAKSEAKQGDNYQALKYADRALMAAKGGPQLPEAMKQRKLPKSTVGDLRGARKRLIAALEAGGRDKAPTHAAHAQAMFDCWMEQQEENDQPKHIAACRAGFEDTLPKVLAALKMAPEAMAKPMMKGEKAAFGVYFAFNSAKITAKGQAVIDQAIKWAKDKKVRSITLSGHADRAGNSSYNQRLSQRRSKAVADALTRGGISANVIQSSASGETRPAVATADGKAEARNRRVEINLAQ
jgi:OOP family OmpA-OmpF porin